MKRYIHTALFLLAVSAMAACSPATTDDALESTDGTANQERVREMYIEQKLITIPEVKAESDRWIAAYRSGEITREEAAKEFRKWLEQWVAENPDRAAAAAGGNDEAADVTPAEESSEGEPSGQ